MSEITINAFVDSVLNGMVNTLDDEQLRQLKDQLYIHLRDMDMIEKSYELIEVSQNSDGYILQRFVASERIRNLSEKSIAQYTNAVMKLRTYVGKNFADINSVDIECYLAASSHEKNWTTNTLLNNIHDLSAFFKYMKKKKMITDNPMDMIDSVKREKVIREKFSTAEIEMLKLACRDNPRDIAMVEFLLATAVRVGELCKLKWYNIDFQHLEANVRQGKGNKDRIVPFSEKAGFYLLRYLDWRMNNENRSKKEMMERPVFVRAKRDYKTKDFEAMGNSGIENILKRIGQKANITSKKNPHKFRRTMATEAINHGMDIEVLMKILGHEEYNTTLQYAEVKTPKVNQQYRMVCDMI